ncbi:putative F-box domain-containing protein [Tanacetum coccineum]
MILETPQVVIDGFIYHLAFDYSKKGYVSNLIISFDLNSEEFREIHLPESIKLGKLSISKLRETLVVLEYNMVVPNGKLLCAVLMMDNDLFTRHYTIKAPTPSFNAILGFQKTSTIIFERRVDNDNKRVLATYEPDSK